MVITIHINIRVMHETKTFELQEKEYEHWILFHAFQLSCSVKVYRPISETNKLIFEYFYEGDFNKTEKWLKEHGEQKR